MSKEKDSPPKLGPGASDDVAAFMRIGAGAIPFIGAGLNELITKVIPGVRQARIEDYLRYLNSKLSKLEEGEFKGKISNPKAIDLFEEGAFQAARSLSNERIEQVSAAVANGLNEDENEIIEAKRILSVLRELDDAQVIILASRLQKNQNNVEFQEKHAAILSRPMAHLQSSKEEVDRSLAYDAGLEKLLSLGLIKRNFKKPRRGELPEFDPQTGMMNSSGTSISPFGRLFLRRIGVAEEDDV